MGTLASAIGVRIHLKHRTVIGRNPSCDLRLAYREVSGEHAEIMWMDGAWRIRDMNSSNGTLLNNQKLSPEDWHALTEGDSVAFGHYQLRYEVTELEPPAP
ncbi:MAG: FHA domain-containing protein [Alphaproteobacteria bacterium]|nr:FHA domain-containing protein [Alphaproteobacteria bacterium]MCB9795389.1 FHA domain-containing protein [Alphaproteobacteria bacterium]